MRSSKSSLFYVPKFRYWAPIFFVFIFTVGLATYKDYGISWDERVERLDGAVALRYIEGRSEIRFPGLDLMLEKQEYPASLELHSYKDRYYPVGFNLPVEAMIQKLGIESEQKAYYFRHLITFSICIVGLWAIFLLAKRRFSDWRMGLLASVMYALTPRLYGEWFYNSKDMVLLSFFAIAMYWAISYLQKPNYRNAVLFGIATGLALNIRLMAIILPMLVSSMLIIQVMRHQVKISTALFTFMLSNLVIALIVATLWPLLWESPGRHLVDALGFMAKYQFKQDILYFGQIISSTNLPWHYLPVWIVITTPIAYLVLWFIGFIVTLKGLFKSKWRLWINNQQMEDIFFLALFLAPLLGFIVLRPVIYDGWRHFYFIYPAFLLISVRGLKTLLDLLHLVPIAKKLTVYLFTFSLLGTGMWMIWAHPLQNVYFNTLVGSNWKSKFDLDYWGLSNRQALQLILEKDSRNNISVTDGAFNFLSLSLSILKDEDAKRLSFIKDQAKADYLISNYRLNSTDFAAMPSNWQLEKNIYAGSEIVSSIYKAKRLVHAPEIELNKEIIFGKSSFGQYFLTAGNWALPEAWGVWAEARHSSLCIPIPNRAPKSPTDLTLHLQALVTPSYPVQRIAIRLNDSPAVPFDLRSQQSNTITMKLPNVLTSDTSHQCIKIDIESLNPVKPSQLGLGDDGRLLSVGLISALLK